MIHIAMAMASKRGRSVVMSLAIQAKHRSRENGGITKGNAPANTAFEIHSPSPRDFLETLRRDKATQHRPVPAGGRKHQSPRPAHLEAPRHRRKHQVLHHVRAVPATVCPIVRFGGKLRGLGESLQKS